MFRLHANYILLLVIMSYCHCYRYMTVCLKPWPVGQVAYTQLLIIILTFINTTPPWFYLYGHWSRYARV